MRISKYCIPLWLYIISQIAQILLLFARPRNVWTCYFKNIYFKGTFSLFVKYPVEPTLLCVCNFEISWHQNLPSCRKICIKYVPINVDQTYLHRFGFIKLHTLIVHTLIHSINCAIDRHAPHVWHRSKSSTTWSIV